MTSSPTHPRLTPSPPHPRLRRITGLKPTGHLQLGNLLAAVRPMVDSQDDVPTLAFVADLHALTVEHDPAVQAELTRGAAAIVLAAGLDPARSILFAQSQVPEHSVAHYLLESTATYGESRRMIQFRDKAAGRDSVRLSLLTYPVLMAADILLYAGSGATVQVPVGEDQDQHLELARTLARRFNRRYGETFTVPRGVRPFSGARIMDLADPTRKMDKTNPVPAGVIYVLDPPDVVRRKVSRAVTDGVGVVGHDPASRPGISNLLAILSCLRGGSPADLAADYPSYTALKVDLTDALVAVLQPLQEAYAGVRADPGELDRTLNEGAARARALAAPTLAAAQSAMGLRAG